MEQLNTKPFYFSSQLSLLPTMFISIKYYGYLIWFGVCIIFAVAIKERKKINYIAFERINVTYYDKEYVASIRLTSRRISREDPVYYANIDMKYIKTLDSDIQMDTYFLEFLTNQYKPTFVELHMRACNFITHKMLKDVLYEALEGHTCPFIAPGEFHFRNLTINTGNTWFVMKNFPIQKGRVNVTYTSVSTGKLLLNVLLDFEFKEMKGKTIRRKRIELSHNNTNDH